MSFLLIDPDDTVDFAVEWGTHLGGDTISSSDWLVTPSGPTLSNEASDGDSAVCFISGCTRGRTYRLTNRIVTTAGRTMDQSFTLRCGQR